MKKVSILVLIWFLSIITFAQTTPNKYLIKYLESNTTQPDYGVTFLSDNQFIYKSPSTEKINNESNKLSVSNLFIATIGKEGEILEKKEIQGIPTNRITKTGAAYSKDLKTVYFSAMKYRKKRKRSDREQLFKADVDSEGNWSNKVKLSFVDPKYSFGEPAMSVDGKELYFTSDMPLTIGGADIFVVAINEDGNFGEVRNLGSTINTSGNEVTAYISKNNMLYFSSDGYPNGLGNLDVYVSDLSSNNIPTTPIHLDAPINSKNDDFSFISNNDKRGYFASNRLQGQNNHDIYSFLVEELIKDEKCVQEIVGVVKDKETELAIVDAKIALFDANNNEIQEVKTDTEGAYKFTLDCNKTYTLKASNKLYSTEEHIVNTANYLDAPILEANKFLIKKTVEDIASTETIVANADEVTEVEESTSIKKDEVNREIIATENTVSDNTEEEVEDAVEEIVAVDTEPESTTEEVAITDIVDRDTNKEDVVEETVAIESVIETSVADTEEYIEENTSSEEVTVKETIAEETSTTTEEDEATINPVYFAFDKSNISTKAAKELDKIANILNNNKNIQIEVSSYTDSRGGSAYNLKLSERRAKASADYLVSIGVDRSRVTTKGYGESKMVNKCIDGVECSEAAHEKNRRTEFAFTNPQVALESSNYESQSIKETEVIKEETTEDISIIESIEEETEVVSVKADEVKAAAVVEEINTSAYADTEESSDESFSELDERQNLTNLAEKEEKPTTLTENSEENKVEEIIVKNNTNPLTKTDDKLTVSEENQPIINPNSLTEQEKEEVLSFQEDQPSKEEVAAKTNEPESQRNAFNELIAEAESERGQENNNTTKSSKKKVDNSTPNKLLSEITSQVIQPTTTKPEDKVEVPTKKEANKTVRDEKSIYVSTATMDAVQSKKGKYIETDKPKKINALRVIFRIKENYLASRGAKDAFIVIKSPKGKVINEKGSFTLVNGNEHAYTDDTTVFFNSQSIKVVMFIDKIIHKFTKGTYTMDVYIEGHLAGSDTLTLI